MIKASYYFVYDYDLSKDWLFRLNLNNGDVLWNESVRLPHKLKNYYLKTYKLKIIRSI